MGLEHRALTAVGLRRITTRSRSTAETEVGSSVTFSLSEVNENLVGIVKRLCAPLFMVYDDIVRKFVEGEVASCDSRRGC